MNTLFNRRVRAFTLVELLVVIAIIAVLISILLPALNQARQQAQTVQCATQMRQVGMAWLQYQNDNGGWVAPMARHWCDSWASNINYTRQSGGITQHPDEAEYRWFHYLNRFTKNYKVFNCPTANITNAIRGQEGGWKTQVKEDGGDGTSRNLGRGYASAGLTCNYAYVPGVLGRWEIEAAPPTTLGLSNRMGVPTWVTTDPLWYRPLKPKRISQVIGIFKKYGLGAQRCVIVMDGSWWVVDNSATALDSIQYDHRYLHYKKRSNALFADGHVESFQKTSFKPVWYDRGMMVTAE